MADFDLDNTSGENTKSIDFFSYYRKLRPEKFSDTRITYEMKLTEELFDSQLAALSVNKKQSLFENFIIRVASTLITPNIKPQTGPDGGGDGKVDGETYSVAKDISDKWFVGDGGCAGEEKWAIAISCKTQWKPKVKKDIANIISTGRGYSKILFFTNQKVKSSTLHEVEDELFALYNIPISIFDGGWCKLAVFHQGCMDAALEELNFSDNYKRRTIVEGPLDHRRKIRLKELETSFLTRQIRGLDTQYVDDLMEANILSRSLELPQVETEGRFRRSLSECDLHGTSQQKFVIIYDHAWTSFFWFKDPEATYKDYKLLKEVVDKSPTVARIEKLTNMATNLVNACRAGLFGSDIIKIEIDYLKELSEQLSLDTQKRSAYIFLEIYFFINKIIDSLFINKMIDEDLDEIEPLLLESTYRMDISFEMIFGIISRLGKLIENNTKYELIIDKLADELSTRESEVAGAKIHLERGLQHMDKSNYKQAIRQFSFCVHAFEKEGYDEELIKATGMMGICLYYEDLLYSAKAFLVKVVSSLMKKFYDIGSIDHLLIFYLLKLCEIELMLGRIVMYLNWRELLNLIVLNGQEYQKEEYCNQINMQDMSWACRFADSNLSEQMLANLPDILDRQGLEFSSQILKMALGYKDKVDTQFIELLGDDWRSKLIKQPVMRQFLSELNISMTGKALLQTIVNNYSVKVEYENSCETQIVAETLLAAIESLLATMEMEEIMVLTPSINISIDFTSANSMVSQVNRSSDYILKINPQTFTDETFWQCFANFMALFFTNNAVTKVDVSEMITNKQEKERIMDRIKILMRNKENVVNVLGKKFKYLIDDWKKDTDTLYTNTNEKDIHVSSTPYTSQKQQTSKFRSVSSNMNLWDEAGWKGCGFIFDTEMKQPAIFGLAFYNINNGTRIVAEWDNLLKENKSGVKIYIIIGIKKEHPHWYRVCIVPDMKDLDPIDDKKRYCTILSRKHTMTPRNSINIDQ